MYVCMHTFLKQILHQRFTT